MRKIKGRCAAMFYPVSPQSTAPAAKENVRPEVCVLCSAARIRPMLNNSLERNVHEPARARGAASSRKVGQSVRMKVTGSTARDT